MGTITWKTALSVPTLSQMMFVLLGLALLALAAYSLRRSNHASRILGIGILAGAVGLIAPPILDLAQAVDNTITVGEGDNACGDDSATFMGSAIFTSVCSDPILIIDISCDISGSVEEPPVENATTNPCAEGQTIQTGQTCSLDCTPV